MKLDNLTQEKCIKFEIIFFIFIKFFSVIY